MPIRTAGVAVAAVMQELNMTLKRILILLLLTGVAAVGQTLHETTQWMQNVVSEHSYWRIKDATGDNSFSNRLTFDSCRVTQSMFENGKKQGDTTYSLKDIDPQSLEVERQNGGFFAVMFDTTNAQDKINMNGSAFSSWVVNLDNGEYAKRFAKAFRHAVVLCGGKPSTF
jgi:hypothetical protein